MIAERRILMSHSKITVASPVAATTTFNHSGHMVLNSLNVNDFGAITLTGDASGTNDGTPVTAATAPTTLAAFSVPTTSFSGTTFARVRVVQTPLLRPLA